MRPAHSVEPNEIIRQCRLQLRGIGAEGPAPKLQAVHVRIAQGTLGGGQVNADLRSGNRRLVIQFVADDVDAEAEFVHQVVGENVRFRDAPEAAVQGNFQREVQIVGGRGTTRLNLKGVGTKGFKRIGVGPEEAL